MVKNEKIPYFCRVVLQNFPFIEEDFDALTTYQLISKVVEYLNKVIKSQNTLVDNVNNLSLAFQQLHDYVENYFANLDVQDEINNKLDQMALDGTLQEIITAYIQANVAWCFDTVGDMKSATNLVAGSYAQTLGFHSLNDGGGAIYYITDTGTADEMSVIAVGSLYANIVVPAVVTPEMFGAYGDGTTDDQSYINKALDSSKHVQFIGGKTYAIRGYEAGQAEGSTTGLLETTGLIVKANTIVDLNFATIKILTNSRQNYHGFTIKNASNVTIKNGNIIGDVDTHTGSTGQWGYGVALLHAENVELRNLIITKCWGDGINLNNSTGSAGSDNKNVYIANCICDDNRRQGMSIESIDTIVVENSKFINTGKTEFTAPGSGVDIEPGNNYNKCEKITFDNCLFEGNYRSGLIMTGSYEMYYISILNSKLINNMAGLEAVNDHGNIAINVGQYVRVENCTIGGNTPGNIYFRTTHSGTAKEHNYFDIKNNVIYNEHFLVRPINCNYVDFNIEGNTITASNNFNTYIIQFETNTGYTTDNKYDRFNCINNVFKCDKTNTVLSWIFCDKPSTSGINSAEIRGNEFYYGTKQIQIGTPCTISENKFICNYTSVIAITGGGIEDSIFMITDNLFEYCNVGNASRGLIEDWPQIYYIYALNNTVLTDKAINNNDIPADPQVHADVMKMFTYDRDNSIAADNNIY